MKPLQLLDLFSGIGGFSLGLERTGGFSTVAFCEIEPFPCKILNKHWPEVPIYDDIRNLTASRLRRDGISVDAICGGFPCQDISTAGKGAGIEGERSGLWSEYARLIGELRPQVVFVENVSALLGRGLGKVLGDLAALGYDAEWHVIPAFECGLPQKRDRVFIVSYDCLHKQLQPCWGVGDKWGWVSDRFQAPSWPLGDQERNASGDGFSDRLVGNAVVPQIPELIGNAYLESIGWRRAA
jgi:DNA (cytosine-5)-methyltransferase 1